MEGTDAIVVLVTAPQGEAAGGIARSLVEERLVACAGRVANVRSVYHWQGRIQEDGEELLVLKTTRAAYGRLEARLKELHPYDVPEILALPVVAGSTAYLDWMRGELQEGGPGSDD